MQKPDTAWKKRMSKLMAKIFGKPKTFEDWFPGLDAAVKAVEAQDATIELYAPTDAQMDKLIEDLKIVTVEVDPIAVTSKAPDGTITVHGFVAAETNETYTTHGPDWARAGFE